VRQSATTAMLTPFAMNRLLTTEGACMRTQTMASAIMSSSSSSMPAAVSDRWHTVVVRALWGTTRQHKATDLALLLRSRLAAVRRRRPRTAMPG